MLDRLPDIMDLPGGYEAIGVARDGALIGGCLYTSYIPCRGGADCQMWAVGEGPWLSRRIIGVMFGYPFNVLGCHRVTLLTAKRNRKARKLIEGLGFRLEGVVRRGLGVHKDACLYGLLREECKWRLAK